MKDLLEDNKRLLLSGYEEFSKNNLSNTVNLLERIHSNITSLSQSADLQANSRFVLRENRELISKEDLEDF